MNLSKSKPVQRTRYRRWVMVSLILAFSVMAADTPPATLPKGFLEKLPILMQLDDEDFELLLELMRAEKAGAKSSESANKDTGEIHDK